MPSRRNLLSLGLASVSAQAFVPRLAFAQATYPDHPIRLVVPFPPGGVYELGGMAMGGQSEDDARHGRR